MSVLDEIIDGVRADLAERQAASPRRAQGAGRGPRGPRTAWRRCAPTASVIAEVKRSSPSKGALAAIADPAALAADYEAGGAHVISVLTEQRRFGGSLADLAAVRAAVDVAVLRKDFVVTPTSCGRRAPTARTWCCSSWLRSSRTRWSRWSSAPSPSGSPRSSRCTTEEEVERAVDAGAKVIGVNARDLKTLRSTAARSPGSPRRSPTTSSRSPSPACAARTTCIAYASAGADAVLVGESLVTGTRPARPSPTWSPRAPTPRCGTGTDRRPRTLSARPADRRGPARAPERPCPVVGGASLTRYPRRGRFPAYCR